MSWEDSVNRRWTEIANGKWPFKNTSPGLEIPKDRLPKRIENLFGLYNQTFIDYQNEMRDRGCEPYADQLQNSLLDLHHHGNRDTKDKTGNKKLDFFTPYVRYTSLRDMLASGGDPLSPLGSSSDSRRKELADAAKKLEDFYIQYQEEKLSQILK